MPTWLPQVKSTKSSEMIYSCFNVRAASTQWGRTLQGDSQDGSEDVGSRQNIPNKTPPGQTAGAQSGHSYW